MIFHFSELKIFSRIRTLRLKYQIGGEDSDMYDGERRYKLNFMNREIVENFITIVGWRLTMRKKNDELPIQELHVNNIHY